MLKLFNAIFAAKPAPAETVTLEYHRSVVAGMQEEIAALREGCFNETQRANRERGQRQQVGAALNEALTERDAARETLRQIAAMETPGSAPIGRRMAAAARAGLPVDEASEQIAA